MTEQNLYSTPQANLNTNQEVYYDPKIFSWSGRIGRLRYLVYGLIMYLALAFAVSMISGIFMPAQNFVGIYISIVLIIYVGAFVFMISLAKRRLNDMDASGWFCLLFLVPIANFVLGLVLLFMPGTKTVNKYGPMPSKDNSSMLLVGAIAGVVIIGILAAIAIPAYQEYVKRAEEQAQRINSPGAGQTE